MPTTSAVGEVGPMHSSTRPDPAAPAFLGLPFAVQLHRGSTKACCAARQQHWEEQWSTATRAESQCLAQSRLAQGWEKSAG